MAAQDQRPRFYESQYLGADDMNAVVEYAKAQLARHALGPHSWGIALGLYLIESPTPGAPERRLVTLMPGLAIDGFARTLIALKRERLSESLFTQIPYDASADDPANHGGKPPGRFVRVWLAYNEGNTKSPPPGFERCDAGNEYARVQETYRFVIGDQSSLTDLRTPLSIAGQAVDAANALRVFDAAAPLIEDASVPQQQFPTDNARARWLVPIGWVRWVAYAQGGGYFVDRNIIAADRGDDRIRKFRRYIGLVTENIHAVEGAIVLRRRGDRPDEPGKFQARLQSGAPLAETFRDLAWIEGNARVVGDTRLAGGALRFADINGGDQQTPLSIERVGDRAGPAGNRSMDALIGPDAQTTNRFAVATVVADNPDPNLRQLSEKLTVMSGGNVGVNQNAPQHKLHVKGDRVRLDSADGKTIEMRTDGSQVDLDSPTSHLFLRSGAGAPPKHIVMNPDAPDGNVGVGTPAPSHKLHVNSNSGIRQNALYLSGNTNWSSITYNAHHDAGNATWVFPDPSRKTITIELDDFNGVPRFEVFSNMAADPAAWRSHFKVMGNSDTTIMAYSGGKVGVGTVAPTAKMTIDAGAAAQGKIHLFPATADFEYDGGADGLFVFRDTGGRTAFMGGNIGIGTGTPVEKLHVAGNFLRVDGAGGEAAYIGGDGSFSSATGGSDVQIGSANNSVQAVHLYNTAYAGWMDVHCRKLTEWSDAVAKKNIEPLEGALDLVQRLRGVHYEWESGTERRQQIGVIAQEVEAVLPQLVSRKRGMLGVSYTSLVPVLIEATKELKRENDGLRSEIDALKQQMQALTEQVRALRTRPSEPPRAGKKKT